MSAPSTPQNQNRKVKREQDSPSPVKKHQGQRSASSPSLSPPPREAKVVLKTASTPATQGKVRPKDTSKSPAKRGAAGPLSPTKSKDGWTGAKRLKLFEAYTLCADVKWDEVATMVGEGVTAKSCREQWQRATGTRIRRSLQDDQCSTWTGTGTKQGR